jgi:hypothetical protein
MARKKSKFDKKREADYAKAREGTSGKYDRHGRRKRTISIARAEQDEKKTERLRKEDEFRQRMHRGERDDTMDRADREIARAEHGGADVYGHREGMKERRAQDKTEDRRFSERMEDSRMSGASRVRGARQKTRQMKQRQSRARR